MSGGRVCTICGEHSLPYWGDNVHTRMECGDWQGLLAALGNLHNTGPERIEKAIRSLLRCEDGQCDCANDAWHKER